MGIKLKAHNLTARYSLLGVLGKHNKKLGGYIFTVLLFHLQFQYKCQDYNKTHQAGEIPYHFINIERKSMVIISYPETWGSEQECSNRHWGEGVAALLELGCCWAVCQQSRNLSFCASAVIPQTLHRDFSLCLRFSYPVYRKFSLRVSSF